MPSAAVLQALEAAVLEAEEDSVSLLSKKTDNGGMELNGVNRRQPKVAV
jgi:hypothetical protein